MKKITTALFHLISFWNQSLDAIELKRRDQRFKFKEINQMHQPWFLMKPLIHNNNDKKIMKNLLLISIVITFTQSLSTQLSQKPTCFSIYSPEVNSKLIVNYQISGMDENQTDVFVTKNDGEVLVKVQNTKDGRIREILKETGNYYACFQSKDKSYKVVSFDLDIEGLDKEYAQSEQFDYMTKELQKTQRNFQNIYRNQHWQSDRENAHALILDQTEKSVSVCAIIKIGVIIAISVSQIYIVYNYFKDKDISGEV